MTVATPKPKKSRRTRKRAKLSTEGTVTLSKSEMVATISVENDNKESGGSIPFGPESMPFLKKLGAAFEQFRWDKVVIYYKPAVGTDYGGMVSVGADFQCTAAVKTRGDVSAYSPNASFAAWADTQSRPMVVPQAKLRGRGWYIPSGSGDTVDKYPFSLKWAAAGGKKTIGELWVQYTVTMQGTAP